MTLRATQELFWRAIAWPTGVADFLAHADEATRRAFADTFASSDGFDRVARMNVYANAYFWRLHEVVVVELELTAWLAGAPRFHDFVTDYVLQHPSRNEDVGRFAAGIPEALREHALERAVPGLADVAAVEWAIVCAIDGPDDHVLQADALAAIPTAHWPALQLHAVRTASLLECRLDFAALHRAMESAEAPPASPASSDHAILVWRRPDLDVHYRSVAPPEARALRALLDARTFSELCDAAAGPRADEATPASVVAWLRRWLHDGLVAHSSSP
jgi:hypothetical protein